MAPLASDTALEKVNGAGLLHCKGLINGVWRESNSGKTLAVINPATMQTVCHVACMGEEETKTAITAADEAFAAWSKRPAKERSKILRKWHDLMVDHKEELAILMTLEQGKPLAEARGEVDYGAGYIELYAEECKRAYGDIIPSSHQDKRILVTRQPVGVVGIITPWNFPIAMIARKVAPALAAGCTVVVKPAELTPLCALAIADLALRAGLPQGVFNVVMGDAPAIGQAMLDSDVVRKLSFTGSTLTGKKLMAMAAGTIKRLSLELGGNAPFIVFDDADLEIAVKGAISSKFRNSGQTCVCANRFLVHEKVYDQFVELLCTAAKKLKVGYGLMEGVTQGPLINDLAVRKVESHIADAVERGAEIVLGGKKWVPADEAETLHGVFFEPTVIKNATPDMLCFREEVFGPVAPIFRFSTEAEAIRLANDTEHGLAAYVYSQELSRAWRVAEALHKGMVGVNESAISSEAAPFGGVKQSGFGREGSKYGLQEYQDMKYICLGNLSVPI